MPQIQRYAWLGFLMAGCAAGLGGNSDDGSAPDGGTGQQPTCDVVLSFPNASTPVAPADIEAQAMIVTSTGGIARYEWLVLDEAGRVVNVELRSPTSTDISLVGFRAESPGPYRVRVSGWMGDLPCTAGAAVLNVAADGAESGYFRLRVVPRPNSQDVPPQDKEVMIRGGANYDLGTVALDPGLLVTGEVTTALAEPVAAYVRATPSDSAEAAAREAFTDTDGAFAILVENRRYDVLVVPQDRGMAPALFREVPARAMQLRMPAAASVAGVMRDAQGTPLPGARIAVQAQDLPASVVETDADGRFALEAPAGERLSLTAVPPAEQSALALVAEGIGADFFAQDVSIVYAPGLETRTVAMQVLTEEGAPAGGARVTWASRDIAPAGAGAGSVVSAGGSVVPARGRVRVTQVADAAGRLPALVLPEAIYDVVIEAEPGATEAGVTWTVVDLAAPPSMLALASPAEVRGQIIAAGGGSIAGARLTARPLGLLAHTGSASATADADGAFALRLAGGGSYELIIEGTEGSSREVIRERWMLDAPTGGNTIDLGTIALRRALRLFGRITINTIGAGGVTVRLLCSACTEAEDPSWALAEAVSNASGAFSLRVPDLGLAGAPASAYRIAAPLLSGDAALAFDK